MTFGFMNAVVFGMIRSERNKAIAAVMNVVVGRVSGSGVSDRRTPPVFVPLLRLQNTPARIAVSTNH